MNVSIVLDVQCRIVRLWLEYKMDTPTEVLDYALSIDDIRIGSCVALTLLAYDYCLTFQQEVDYVWFQPWNFGKVIFLVLRYLPWVDHCAILLEVTLPVPITNLCRVASYWHYTCCVLGALLADSVIGLRTWAIWERSRTAAVFVSLSWLGMAIGSIYYFSLYQTGGFLYEPLPADAPTILGCHFTVGGSDASFKMYIALGSYQIVIFLATVVRGFTHLRNHPAQVMTIMYRDAFLASICLFMIVAANLVLAITDSPFQYGLIVIYRAFLAILPARIILNMREASMSVNGFDLSAPELPKPPSMPSTRRQSHDMSQVSLQGSNV
ncbi:hypothetical protein CALCODRAFT_453129 [Calocera cornea HHB12733]|uniref:DUF6533 domain-containing protein n=1 Tax=Calocera cornea HHB12733 TaxID=1353952 RepID=A0A165FXS3_9BASI|nr:hypothetical protein CALCODRAFT_453129 [Calocera cornea HHB12733]